MKTRYLFLLRFILVISDLVIVNLAFLLSFYFVNPENIFNIQCQQNMLIVNLLWLFTSNVNHLYQEYTIRKVELIYRYTLRAFLMHLVLYVFYLAFLKESYFSLQFVFVFYSSLSMSFLLSRFAGTGIELILKRHFKIRRQVAVLGMNRVGLRLAQFFEKNNNNFSFEGFLNGESGLSVDESGNILPIASEQIRIAAQHGVKDVYVSLNQERMALVGDLLQEAEKRCVRLKFVPDIGASFTAPFALDYLDEFPVISLRKEPLEEIENRFKKRFFDIIFSICVFVLILSWLYPIIAVLIKLQSPGPVLFKQLRSGRNNVPFWCYKFRSMKVNAESDSRQASKEDDRITSIGKFLRKTSLDELPQFFNVLLGDMSVVGPRPHMLKHTEQYSPVINRFMVRHLLKPGITGWAQVNGFRGETKENESMEKRVEHDIWYMENWTLMLDVKIIFMTVLNVFKGEVNAF